MLVHSEKMNPMEQPLNTAPQAGGVPATLVDPVALRFWLAVLLTGIGTGIAAVLLMLLLNLVQHTVWPSADGSILAATSGAPYWKPILIMLSAGLLTGIGQLILVRLSSGNGIDITEAMLLTCGRLPKLRTLCSAVLSTIIVAMGASLGREGAPKQTGSVIANLLSDRTGLSNEQRRLLVACGAGAGMAAAYGVPLGGAIFALEVLRGELALRFVLPALLASLAATAVSWLVFPLPFAAHTYVIAPATNTASLFIWAGLMGPVAGVLSLLYVRAIAFVVRHPPQGWYRFVFPILGLGLVGCVGIRFPQVLGNGKDLAQLAFLGKVPLGLLVTLLFLRPIATIVCLGSGAPGGLFTPTLTIGAMLGGALGYGWSLLYPGVPPGVFAFIGAAAMLAATTQGPISSAILMIELTGYEYSSMVPLLLAVVTATLIARSFEIRSIYDARLSDEQIQTRQRAREKMIV